MKSRTGRQSFDSLPGVASRRQRKFAMIAIGIVLLGYLPGSAIPLTARGDDPAKGRPNSTTTATKPAAAESPEASDGAGGRDKLKSMIPQGLQSLPQSLFKLLHDGGLMMIPIVACSVIMLAYGLERLVVLRRRRVIPRDFVKRFINHLEQGQLDRTRALKLCEDNGSPIADIFAHAVRKWGKPAVEIEQAVIDGGERQIGHLRKNLRVLNGVATVGPLLGLLGTVIGMIQCFNEIAGSAQAMGKAKQLAGGIGVALITTAGGLVVAIPAMILYMYLIGRVDSLVVEMDLLSQKVVDLISAEGLSAAPPRPAPAVAPRPRAPVPEPKRPVLG